MSKFFFKVEITDSIENQIPTVQLDVCMFWSVGDGCGLASVSIREWYVFSVLILFECARVWWSVVEYCGVLGSIVECCGVL